jgi:pimeloyl-ACP methyl ester carboxylesterase
VEDPLEVWQKIFPNVRGKYLGEYGHFLQWEAPEEVNRELLAFLGEGG